MPPKNGKICYIEIPAADAERSADFYTKVFGWNIRKRGDGAIAFDDTTGEVSGAWISGRKAAESGLLFYIMVDSVVRSLAAVVANGGEVAMPLEEGPEIIATRDTAWNFDR